MQPPRFAHLSISLDTESFKLRRQEERDHIWYLLERLMTGETAAQSEFEHMGMKIGVRDAVRGEIIRAPK